MAVPPFVQQAIKNQAPIWLDILLREYKKEMEEKEKQQKPKSPSKKPKSHPPKSIGKEDKQDESHS